MKQNGRKMNKSIFQILLYALIISVLSACIAEDEDDSTITILDDESEAPRILITSPKSFTMW